MKKIKQLIVFLVVAMLALLCLPLFDMIYLYPSTTQLVVEKLTQDAESLGQYLMTELTSEGGTVDIERLPAMVESFNLESISLYGPDGGLLFSTADSRERQRDFRALNLLKRGQLFSRTVIAAGSETPRQLIEVQLPMFRQGELDRIVVLVQDMTSVRSGLDNLISQATVFLLLMAAFVFAVVVWTITQARMAISKQIEGERQLSASRNQLAKKHQELEQVFDLVEQAKQEWQLALDCITDMIFMIDEEGRIRRCNEALIRFLGLSYLDILGKNWQKVLLKKNRPTISLDRQNTQVYHEQNQAWLKLEFYPYQTEGRERLAVIRVQEQGA